MAGTFPSPLTTRLRRSPADFKHDSIPALTDTFTDGKLIRLFESGSIMQYLVARYDKEHKLSYPEGSREAIEVTNWLFFMNAGVGPMQGQANHFTRTFVSTKNQRQG